jgi:hypothetical protein
MPGQHIHAQLIDALGGNAKVGAALGRHNSTVSRWRVNGITPRAWPAVVRLAGAAGIRITVEQIEATSPPFGIGGHAAPLVPPLGRPPPAH